jgi:hypothetical protein
MLEVTRLIRFCTRHPAHATTSLALVFQVSPTHLPLVHLTAVFTNSPLSPTLLAHQTRPLRISLINSSSPHPATGKHSHSPSVRALHPVPGTQYHLVPARCCVLYTSAVLPISTTTCASAGSAWVWIAVRVDAWCCSEVEERSG